MELSLSLRISKPRQKVGGVRSHDRISSGSFICEYLGATIQDGKAIKMTDNDQYLFTLGIDIVYDNYTINVNHNVNVARIMNHSCSLKLFCLKVLFIMLTV
jgi:euchromatic histone-lysine N-methyltransferase